MNQLTTIASLPSGGGQAQALKAETTPTRIVENKEALRLSGLKLLADLGYAVDEQGFIIHIDKG